MAHFSLPLQPFPFPVLAVPHPCKSEAGVLLSCSHLSSNYPWNPKELGGDRGGRGCLDSCLEQAGFVTSCPPPTHTHHNSPAFHRHDQRAFRGWSSWLWSPAGHWPRDSPAEIPGPCHSRGSGECSSRAPRCTLKVETPSLYTHRQQHYLVS